jgi:hypothetical protein
MHRFALAALAATIPLSLPAPATAADHAFKLLNNVGATLTGFRVRGGEVEGFTRTGPGDTLTVTVTLPDGQCDAFISARFGSAVVDGRANICDEEGYVVTPGPGPSGLQFLKRSQVMIAN